MVARRTPSAPLLILLGLLFLTRLPLLGHGYGSDEDAWRNVVAALHSRAAGAYLPSRVPGFPVFELLLIVLVPLRWVATNGAAAIAGLVAVGFFHLIAQRVIRPHAGLLTLALALAPALWVSATQTMDYAFGLAFMLGAWWMLLEERAVAAGVLLALAAGCRATYAMLAAPALLGLVFTLDPGRKWIRFLAGFAITGLVLAIPVLTSPGLHRPGGELMFHAGRQHVTGATFGPVVRAALTFLFGKFGVVAIAIGLVLGVLQRRRRRPTPAPGFASQGSIVFELGSVLLLCGFYLLIPLDPAYLLPVLPLALLLLARRMPRVWLVAAMALMVSEALVMPVVDRARIVPGRVWLEVRERERQLAETHALAALAPAQPTVFVVGRPQIQRLLVLHRELTPTEAGWAPFHASGVALWRRDGRVGYAATLDPPEQGALEQRGYAIEAR